jgi:hypothetical protein
MAKTSLIVVMCILWGASACFAQSAEKKLIPVHPSYHEATYVPQSEKAAYDLPSPRDQMYVFWILGRVLSFPFDKAESFIDSWKQKRKASPAASAIPAAAPAANPFASVNWEQIPPAPPASGVATPRR